jgi:hypothetical protein
MRQIPLPRPRTHLHGNTDKVLDELHILAAVLREVFELGDARDVGLPSWKGHVLHFYLCQPVEIGWREAQRTERVS